MKKILVYGMTSNRGGMESYIMTMFRNADRQKLSFDFITDFDTMAYDTEVTEAGSIIHYIPSKSRHPLGHLLAFCKVLKDHPEYDAVYFNILNAGAAYSMMAPVVMGKKIITHSHSNSTDSLKLHKIFKAPCRRWSGLKLACSDSAAEYMFGKDNCHVINNAINVEDYVFSPQLRRDTRQELGIEDDTFALLHVGRIATEKNPFFVVRTFAEVLKINPKSRLIYVGTGAMEQETKALADRLDVADKIMFLGMRKDLPRLYQAADAFMLPSIYEGLGIVLIEAQAAGLKCFASSNVPDAAKVTDLLEYIDLADGEAAWAEKIVGSPQVLRRDMTAEIESAGFSATKSTGELVDVILNFLG